MSIKIENVPVSGIYYGSNAIKEIYQGSTKINL